MKTSQEKLILLEEKLHWFLPRAVGEVIRSVYYNHGSYYAPEDIERVVLCVLNSYPKPINIDEIQDVTVSFQESERLRNETQQIILEIYRSLPPDINRKEIHKALKMALTIYLEYLIETHQCREYAQATLDIVAGIEDSFK